VPGANSQSGAKYRTLPGSFNLSDDQQSYVGNKIEHKDQYLV